MNRSSFLLLLPSLVATLSQVHLAAAQYPITTSLLFLDTDPQPLVASIIAANGATTTYSVNCAPGTDNSGCGIAEGATVTIAPSAYDFYYGANASAFAASEHCQLSGTVPTLCTVSAGGDDADAPGIATVTPGDNQYDGYTYLPVIITDGPAAAAVASSTTGSPATTSTSTSTATAAAGGVVAGASSTIAATATTTTISATAASSASVLTSSALIVVGSISTSTTVITPATSSHASSSMATSAAAASFTGAAGKLIAPGLLFAAAGILDIMLGV